MNKSDPISAAQAQVEGEGEGEDDWIDGEPFDPDRVKPFLYRDQHSVSMYFELSSIQSRMRSDDPSGLALDYTRSMMGALLLKPQPRSVLMIGLGGGSLVKYLHSQVPSAVVTVVEINPHVIALRDAFEVPPDDARLEVVCADGADYVAAPGRSHDLVMVDGFNYEGQPEALCTPGFYAACRQRLAPGGVLVVNLHADDDLEHRLMDRISLCFDGALVSVLCADKGNRIVFAGDLCRPGLGAALLRQHWAAMPAAHRDTLAWVRPALQRALAGRV